MDENDKPLEELSETVTPTPATTLKKRFMGFALCHILYSFVFFVLFLLVLFVLAQSVKSLAPSLDGDTGIPSTPLMILGVVCMLPYFPLGMLKAKRGRWTVPSRREKILAVAQPCVVSVLWVLLLWLLVAVEGVLLDLYILLSVYFAAPSSYFFWFFLVTTYYSFNAPGWLWWSTFFVAPVLSAILPPLLFGLGSFWQAKRQNLSPQT